MTVKEAQERLDYLLEQRSGRWKLGLGSADLEAAVAQAHEDLRRAKVEDANGSHDSIMKRARIEREIEKLSTM